MKSNIVYFIYKLDDFREEHVLNSIKYSYESMKNYVAFDLLSDMKFEEWLIHEVDNLNFDSDAINDMYRISERSFYKFDKNKNQKEFFYIVSKEYNQILDEYLFYNKEDCLEWIENNYEDNFGSDKNDWINETIDIISTTSYTLEPEWIIVYKNNQWIIEKAKN